MIEHLIQNPTATILAIALGLFGISPPGLQTVAYSAPPPLPPIPVVDPVDEDQNDRSNRPTDGPKPLPAAEASDGQKLLIEKALRGESVDAPDNMFGDVVEMIQRRGSLLDGSELSRDLPSLDLPSGGSAMGSVPGHSPDLPPVETQSGYSEAEDSGRISRQLRAAEQLVRAARLLHETDPDDESTRQLVNQMRLRAVKLIQP